MGNLRWIKLGLTTSSTNHWLFMGKLLKLRMPWLIHLWNQDNNTYPVRIKYHNKTKFQVLYLINSSNCQGNLIFLGGRVDFSGGDWRKRPFHQHLERGSRLSSHFVFLFAFRFSPSTALPLRSSLFILFSPCYWTPSITTATLSLQPTLMTVSFLPPAIWVVGIEMPTHTIKFVFGDHVTLEKSSGLPSTSHI